MMARHKKYQSAAEKQKAYRRRKRNAGDVNRNALVVFTCYDCGRRYIGFDAKPKDGCGCLESAGRVPYYVMTLESNH
jgi:hypothetical protein